jgi:HSP20 family protein
MFRVHPLKRGDSFRWDPWQEMQNIRAEIAQISGQMVRHAPHETASPVPPHLEICDAGDAYLIEVDIPGVLPDEVTATIEGSVLRICGERRATNPQAESRLSPERRIGPFAWTATLPDDADVEAATATLTRGVLGITVPKRWMEPRRKIRVAIVSDR